MRSAEKILALYTERKAKYSLLHQKMAEVASIYNGNAEIPLPDIEESQKPSVPNLLAQGVDQMAGRITSVVPTVAFSSQKPGVRKYDRMALSAADTVTGWWQLDRLMMKQKQRGRRLIAYGMAPVVMRWDFKNHRPVWEVRHPMETYPALDLQPGQIRPTDCIFSYRRTFGFLQEAGYGHLVQRLAGRIPLQRDSIITLVEYMDADHTVLIACGYYESSGYYGDWGTDGNLKGVVLETYDNLATGIPVSIPTRLTLDAMTGQFDNMIGMFYAQAKLMALEQIAVEKGIFPDTYLISRPGEVGRFVDGPHDGRTGLINIVSGGDIREMQSQPGYLTNPTIDRLERAQRVTSGIPAEFGGESGSNIRTGRRGDAVLSAVIDYPVAEAQEAFSYALEEENRIAMSMAKRIDGDTPRTIYVGTSNNRKPVTYKPTETFAVEDHVVSYPAAGSDVNQLIIGLGQRVGLGTMSKRTAAELDPFVDNPEAEHDMIISEGLEQALVAGIQQQATSGQIPPLVLSKIINLVKSDKMELAEAINKVTEDAAAEQAAQAQTPMDPAAAMGGEMGMPTADQVGAPGALAAMAGPMAAIEGPSPSQYNLGQLLTTLRRGSRSVA